MCQPMITASLAIHPTSPNWCWAPFFRIWQFFERSRQSLDAPSAGPFSTGPCFRAGSPRGLSPHYDRALVSVNILVIVSRRRPRFEVVTCGTACVASLKPTRSRRAALRTRTSRFSATRSGESDASIRIIRRCGFHCADRERGRETKRVIRLRHLPDASPETYYLWRRWQSS